MTSEFTREELAAALDEAVRDALDEAGICYPPVDAIAVASALGLTIATDDRQAGRARFVRLREGEAAEHGSILVRPEPRPERLQWAIAHEIGESRVERVFARLSIEPHEVGGRDREQLANQLANRLLLPRAWFERDALRCNWNLLTLKSTYATASHELIARRMLDFAPPVIITVFDNGRQTWRQSNVAGRVPPLAPPEHDCWQLAHETGKPHSDEISAAKIDAWPIHEPAWKREIVRTALADAD